MRSLAPVACLVLFGAVACTDTTTQDSTSSSSGGTSSSTSGMTLASSSLGLSSSAAGSASSTVATSSMPSSSSATSGCASGSLSCGSSSLAQGSSTGASASSNGSNSSSAGSSSQSMVAPSSSTAATNSSSGFDCQSANLDCYLGPAGTQGVGRCKGGTLTCTSAGTGTCEQQVLPAEVDDCNGMDDDCDGNTDEGDPTVGTDCTPQGVFGVCALGHWACQGAGGLKCIPASPEPESCNGLDDNCDSTVDEEPIQGLGMQCDTGLLGLCSTGITTCQGEQGVACVPSVTPGLLTESCNGLDDNCNGLADDGIPQVGRPCTAQGFLGACQMGQYTCPSSAPFQLQCQHPQPGTLQEICNGVDDDCNGTIDDPALVGCCMNGAPC